MPEAVFNTLVNELVVDVSNAFLWDAQYVQDHGFKKWLSDGLKKQWDLLKKDTKKLEELGRTGPNELLWYLTSDELWDDVGNQLKSVFYAESWKNAFVILIPVALLRKIGGGKRAGSGSAARRGANVTRKGTKRRTRARSVADPKPRKKSVIKTGPKTTKSAQAEKLLSRARAAEPKVTKDLSHLAKATGGKQEGLDFRLKTKESLARKLETTNPENINDSLRYTITYPSEKIGAGANKVMKQLEDAGYTKVKVKNTFKSGSPYKGINTTFRTPDGQPFELQFHTPESFHAKQNLTHGMYEELRSLPGDSPKAGKLLKEIKSVSDKNVPIPDGIQDAVPNF